MTTLQTPKHKESLFRPNSLGAYALSLHIKRSEKHNKPRSYYEKTQQEQF